MFAVSMANKGLHRWHTTTNQLVEVFPVILRHQPERAEHRPAEVVEVGVSVVRIIARLAAHVALWTRRRLVSSEVTQTDTELVMGHFFKTQPNPQKSSPDPTQPFIHTWYGILGYTENFLQQLLHVTDKFYKPTVNESYYSAAVLINRQ